VLGRRIGCALADRALYQAEGDDWVFLDGPTEILRVKAAEVSSITKAR
jgi:hypothetical protein